MAFSTAGYSNGFAMNGIGVWLLLQTMRGGWVGGLARL